MLKVAARERSGTFSDCSDFGRVCLHLSPCQNIEKWRMVNGTRTSLFLHTDDFPVATQAQCEHGFEALGDPWTNTKRFRKSLRMSFTSAWKTAGAFMNGMTQWYIKACFPFTAPLWCGMVGVTQVQFCEDGGAVDGFRVFSNLRWDPARIAVGPVKKRWPRRS